MRTGTVSPATSWSQCWSMKPCSDGPATTGALRVVAPPAFAVRQLAKHLPRFRAAHPRLAITPPPALVTGQLEMLSAAARAGAGITGLPSFVVEDALRDGRLERVLPSWHGLTQTLYAALPTRRQVPARARVFVDFLVQAFGGADRDPWLPAGGAVTSAGQARTRETDRAARAAAR